MANRDYLYSTNHNSPDVLNPNDDPYYFDSRGDIPVVWFFLFDVGDIKTFQVVYDLSSWYEVYLVSEKAIALHRLDTRTEAIIRLTNGAVHQELLEELKSVLVRYPGKNLLMYPHADHQSEDHNELIGQFRELIETIDTPKIPRDELISRLKPFNSLQWEGNDRARLHGIGYHYR